MKESAIGFNGKAYLEYWGFSHRRQMELFDRGSSQDHIIQRHKFTNCYRFMDRTSQYLIKNIINKEEISPEDTFIQIILFKIFNKIETWEAICGEFGYIGEKNINLERLKVFLDKLRGNKKIYSAAYIMPSGLKEYGGRIKHHNNLAMIDLMLKLEFQKRVWDKKNLEDIYNLFSSIPSIGRFLAYQYSIDVAYSEYSSAEEGQFVVAGPGAERGIKKCFPNMGGYSFQDIIKIMHVRQREEFSRLGLDFHFIGGRDLQLIDCQNIFCELDKYLRVKMPELDAKAKRIKQIYKPKASKIDFEAPRKWNLSFSV